MWWGFGNRGMALQLIVGGSGEGPSFESIGF